MRGSAFDVVSCFVFPAALVCLLPSCGGTAVGEPPGSSGGLGGSGSLHSNPGSGQGGSDSTSGGAPAVDAGAGATGGSTSGAAGMAGAAGSGGAAGEGGEGQGGEGQGGAGSGEPADAGAAGHAGAAGSGSGSGGRNLIANPGFEAGHAGWQGFGHATIVDVEEEPHTGHRCIAATGRTESWNGPMLRVDALLSAGTSYHASAWVRVGGAVTQPVQLMLRKSCEAEAASYVALASVSANGEWTFIEGTFTAPSCALTNASLYLEGPPAEVDLYVDDVGLFVADDT